MPDLMLFLLAFAASCEESCPKVVLQVALVFNYYSLAKMATSLRSCDGKRSCCSIDDALIPGSVGEDGEEEASNDEECHNDWSFYSAIC
jgi:hypothetical protein